MKKIILVSGKLNAGKNQFTDYIKEFLEARGDKVSCDLFARGVKDGSKEDFKEIYEYINSVIENAVKDIQSLPEAPNVLNKTISNLEELITTPENFYEDKTDLSRRMLQNYGTNIFRKRVEDDWWVKDTVKRLQNTDSEIIILTDVRFPNEIEYVSKFFNVTTIRINREMNREKDFNEHESEKALDNYKGFDVTISNNSDLESLRKKAELVANKYV